MLLKCGVKVLAKSEPLAQVSGCLARHLDGLPAMHPGDESAHLVGFEAGDVLEVDQ